MTIERALRAIAGSFILLSLLLAWSVNGVGLGHATWLWFTAFIGLNLLQSGFTDWCPMIWILQRAGLRRQGEGAAAPGITGRGC
jgi:hypothetical protein